MPRRARLTVIELGASPTAWVSHYSQGADDCVVVAQQRDESGEQFTERVQQRARRLRREDTRIESVHVYAGPRSGGPSSAARCAVIAVLANQMAAGGQLTLWSAAEVSQGDAELAAALAQFQPILTERQIAMNHQNCESEATSGVRHAIPLRPSKNETGHGYEEFG